MGISVTINGQHHNLDVPTDTPLLWVIRDNLKLTGTKFGCGLAQCGACTVHLEGQPIRACVTPISAVAGQNIQTIEGVQSKAAKAVQAAWEQFEVPQCGYCQSGQIMAAAALLTNNNAPSDSDIDAAMSGNICRCATYVRIKSAIKDAAQQLQAGGSNA
ncbi:(2Fe-2S)-binding protein [Enterovibrio nigricans]|uniref:Isoquinoline 1-oxidoreductase, alpha subunit n=1 Tax=Enterovibrio nigricans DSM 22720 TaxID=1121868 RepID=A0A1T4UDH6_9GAMM|nr:(2Fe-2S)-binding protein [Enterovibrio nigricans]PKF50720.1 (2Fe-2S)-binding protein [Enterovibrio nigricans]SKA50724.1 isoquinoline 1-oxidoreductase, alpha subunit [Enterovibrio nigricans DSM 22720]